MLAYIFLFIGGEPAATILTFALAAIHLHPDVLQQLLSEIDEVLGKKKIITYEDLCNLKYTEQVSSFVIFCMCCDI